MESKPSPSLEKQGFSSPISPLMGIGTSFFGGKPTLPTVKLSSPPDSGDGENSDIPKPLGALQEPPVPPFLTKTYELVDDPALDPTVSWGLNGESFVVWDHADFAQTILPRHFKHGNFSSFVRQLNTYVGIIETEPEMAAVIYSSCFAAESISVKSRCIMYIGELGRYDSGFRKVDSDRWEFANEDFLRGKKHLLKNIHRRKSLHIQPSGHFVGSSFEAGKVGLELQVEKLRHGKNILMQEVLKLQQQQRLAASQMDLMNQRLQAAEQKQKQMLSFLTKVIQNPAFLIHLIHQKERRKMGSSRIKRKFLKQRQSNQSYSGSSMEGQIVRYGADLGDTAPSLGMPELQSTEIPDYLLPDIAMKHDFDASPETKIGNILLDKTKLSIEVAQEPVTVLDQKSAGISSLQLLDSPNVFLNGNNDLSSQTDGVYSDAWFFSPSPESFSPEKMHSTSGLHFEASEPIIKQEEIFNMGFDSGVSDHSSICNIWENSFNYEVQELDGDGGLCSFWDLQQAEEASRINPWDSDGYYLDDLDSQIEEPKQDHPQLLHQERVPF